MPKFIAAAIIFIAGKRCVFFFAGFVPNSINIMTFECFEQIVDKLIITDINHDYNQF